MLTALDISSVEVQDNVARMQEDAVRTHDGSAPSTSPSPVATLRSQLVAGTGAIQGVITDDFDEAVSGVNLTATNNATKYSTTVTAGEYGTYFLVLPIGTYSLLVVHPSLKMYHAMDIVIRLQEIVNLPIQLHVGQKCKKHKKAISRSRKENQAIPPCKPSSSSLN